MCKPNLSEGRYLAATLRRWIPPVLAGGFVLAGSLSPRLEAETIVIPNASFESPATPYVSVNIDNWQKSPKPDWYVEDGGFLWVYLTGLFKNPPTNSSDHLDNCDGDQAMWLFADPEVGLFQDYDTVDWNDPAPSHAFDARFEVGKSYTLTVGVNGGGGGMLEGATMELRLYYRDGASNKVTVAATSITNTLSNFPVHTHFTDYQVRLERVNAGDAWAGQHIGVEMVSTVDTNLQGGYWDLDHVRLSAVLEPVWQDIVRTNNQFGFALRSEPGLAFEILATTDLAQPTSDWQSLGLLTNTTGVAVFTDPATNLSRRYYRARLVP
jgi:hypothetical protein